MELLGGARHTLPTHYETALLQDNTEIVERDFLQIALTYAGMHGVKDLQGVLPCDLRSLFSIPDGRYRDVRLPHDILRGDIQLLTQPKECRSTRYLL